MSNEQHTSSPLHTERLSKTVENGLLRVTVTFELLREPRDADEVMVGFAQMTEAIEEYVAGLRSTQREVRNV